MKRMVCLSLLLLIPFPLFFFPSWSPRPYVNISLLFGKFPVVFLSGVGLLLRKDFGFLHLKMFLCPLHSWRTFLWDKRLRVYGSFSTRKICSLFVSSMVSNEKPTYCHSAHRATVCSAELSNFFCLSSLFSLCYSDLSVSIDRSLSLLILLSLISSLVELTQWVIVFGFCGVLFVYFFFPV